MSLNGKQKSKNTLISGKKLKYVWDLDEDYISWEGDAALVWKLDEDAIPGTKADFSALVNPQDLPLRMSVFSDAFETGISGEKSVDLTYRLRCGDGTHVYVKERARMVLDLQDQHLVYGELNFLEATQESSKEKQAFNNLKMIDFDGTDHSGRHRMYQHLQAWLDENTTATGTGYFMTVGIDRLSLFNEAFGVEYADGLIEKTGAHLQDILGSNVHISRVSGDVYGALIAAGPPEKMGEQAQHILNSFCERPLDKDLGPVRIGVSIGGIILDDGDMLPASILAKAELALRAAKEQGRGCFISYADITQQTKNYREMLVSGDMFLDAMQDNRLRLAFQPVMDPHTQEVSFYECLVRILDKDGGTLNAAEFVPAVEELGLARVLDKYIMRLAIDELAMFPDLHLSVNVSNWSLTDPNWLKGIIEALQGRLDIARRLIVEITESVTIHDMEKTRCFVKTLKNLGCRIALDDFGTGYTTFSQLQELDIDIVKIDKSFVSRLDEGNNHLFVKTLHSLAEGINMITVGEGVETEEAAAALAADGINQIQGYFYGKPSMERIWLSQEDANRNPVTSDLPSGEDRKAIV